MSRSRVLIPLYAFYPSQIGGPCNTLYWLGKELHRNGVQVTAVASDIGLEKRPMPTDQWMDLDGIKIRYCKTKRPKLSLKITWHSLLAVRKSDVMLFSSLCYLPYFIIGLWGVICGKKIIWSPRGELFDDAVGSSSGKRLYFKLIKAIFKRSTLFHATSEEELQTIHRYFGSDAKCITLPNYMELPPKVENTTTEKYLLFVGRIAPIKALENLIQGVALSTEFRDQGYKLVIAGKTGGEYFDKIVNLIKSHKLSDRVEFRGMVEGEEKDLLYAGAKATMLVSHSENFGNVVIESLAQATPVIASHGTPWQTLPKLGCGYWINNSPENIANTVDNLLSLPQVAYEQMRQKSNNTCRDTYDIRSNVDKWIRLINYK